MHTINLILKKIDLVNKVTSPHQPTIHSQTKVYHLLVHRIIKHIKSIKNKNKNIKNKFF